MIVLTGAWIGVITAWISYREKPYALNFGLVSLVLSSSGTALGLWKIAGQSGWKFLGFGIGMTVVLGLLTLALGKWRPIYPVQDADVSSNQQAKTNRNRRPRRPK